MESKMQVDRYTKFILTVIAVCLVVLCFRGVRLFPPLYGSAPEITDVRIRAIEQAPGQHWDPVMIGVFEKLPVEVANINAVPVVVNNPILAVDVKNVDVKSSLKPIEDKK